MTLTEWKKVESIQNLYKKPTEKRPLGGLRLRLKDNIRIDLKGIDANLRNWIYSAQDSDCCPCECGIVHPDSISRLESKKVY